jgi:D-amino-acid dehydrogenase
MTMGISTKLEQMGVEIVTGAEVSSFATRDGIVRSVRTSAGEMAADAVVLAAGSWTQPLAAKLGSRFPMEPGKGYSFLVRPKVMPRHGILFADIHAGATPFSFSDRLRLGGTMEFSGYNLELDQRRIDNILRLAKDYIELDQPSYEEPWAGLRPLTPDGLPVIDRALPFGNAYVATGYSMLGMTVGAPAGRALTEFMLNDERPAVLEPFRVDRFKGFPLGRRHAVAASA